MSAERSAPRSGRPDRARRLLALAVATLPASSGAWGAAMLAELDAIDEPGERRRFARGASLAALGVGLGRAAALATGVGFVVALITLATSRAQIGAGGPGVLSVTVPVPALILLVVSAVAAWRAGSWWTGLRAGLLGYAASFLAVATVVAIEGLVWMDRRGVFVLDGDPPKTPVTSIEVVLDLFTTGMWIGHVVFWLPWPLIGASLGSLRRARRAG